MDLKISNWIVNTFGSSKIFAEIAKLFSWLGSKWVIMAVLLVLFCFKRTRKMAVVTAIVGMVAFLFNDYLLKLIIHRNRPFEDEPSLVKIMNLINYTHPSGSSMPSGHAAVAMGVAISMMMFSRRFGVPAVIWAVLVGASRLCLCAHYFTDVLAGFAVGAVFAVVIYFISKVIIKKYFSRGHAQANRK